MDLVAAFTQLVITGGFAGISAWFLLWVTGMLDRQDTEPEQGYTDLQQTSQEVFDVEKEGL